MTVHVVVFIHQGPGEQRTKSFRLEFHGYKSSFPCLKVGKAPQILTQLE